MSAYYHVIFSLVFSIFGHYIECAFFDYTDVISDDLYQYWQNSTIESNRACTATYNGVQLDGVCKNIAECVWSRGISRRATACGFLSQCCIHHQGCNGRTGAKVSYFTNSSLQTIPIQDCGYTVQLMNRNICQLRLDFVSMSIEGPDPQGECVNGAFSVRSFPTMPRICGTNNGQHMYVQMRRGQVNSVVLNVQTQIVNPTWLIKVTQLHCPGTNVFNLGNQYRDMAQDFTWLAPRGCIQYYRQPYGEFRTFGHTNNTDTLTYMRPLGYPICFRNPDPSQNRCMKFVLQDFQLTGPDFLYIPGATSETVDVNANGGFTGEVTEPTTLSSPYPGPHWVYFQSSTSTTDVGRGFRISYDTSAQNCPAQVL